MHLLQSQLAGFESALLTPLAGNPQTLEIQAFLRGIQRKIRFVELHSAVLTGIDWERVESIGRRQAGASNRNSLSIALADASLTIEHSDAVVDHVYAAFDGLTAALVNMTDTMGRLINTRYALGIDPMRASLLALKNHCAATSPIYGVVNDARHYEWLRRVRDLRGRCQHADVEHVLVTPEGTYARRGQPIIPSAYCWHAIPRAMPIVDYSQDALNSAEQTLLAVISAVIAAPNNPLQ